MLGLQPKVVSAKGTKPHLQGSKGNPNSAQHWKLSSRDCTLAPEARDTLVLPVPAPLCLTVARRERKAVRSPGPLVWSEIASRSCGSFLYQLRHGLTGRPVLLRCSSSNGPIAAAEEFGWRGRRS